MWNYVNTLIIGKSTGANAGTTLPTMVAGDVLFIATRDNSVLTAATAAALPDNAHIQVAMGLGAGGVRLSAPFSRKSITKFIREAYRAPAYQVDTVTTAMTAGKTYRLTVVLKDEFRVISNRQTKLEIPGFLATNDVAGDIARLVRQINKNKLTNTLIVASAGATAGDLVLTAQAVPTQSIDDYQIVAFNTVFVEEDPTSLNPSLSGGTPRVVVTNTKPDPGSGVAVQLKQTEREASGYLGNTDLRSFDRPTLVSRVDPSGTYDLIHVLHFDKHQGDHEFTMESPVQTTIATVSGSTLSTYVETVLKAFVNKDAAATPTSAGPDPDQPGGE